MEKKQVLKLPDWLQAYEETIIISYGYVNSIRAYTHILADPKHEPLYPFFNRSLFVAMNNLDLLIALKYLDLSNLSGNGVEAKYFARIVALHLHEIFSDINKLIDKQTRKTIENLLGAEFLYSINEAVGELNSLKDKHAEELKQIRHNVIGHKDADSIKQADLIKSIDVKRLRDLASKTLAPQLKISSFYTSVVEKINPIPSSHE